MKIQESAENYLEAILMLKQQNGWVRSIDIATHMEFTKPSVSIAMKKLRESGYIDMDADGHISLTPKGQTIAEKVLERHTVISTWLMSLGVEQQTALEDACRIEHVISEETFAAIKRQAGLPEKN